MFDEIQQSQTVSLGFANEAYDLLNVNNVPDSQQFIYTKLLNLKLPLKLKSMTETLTKIIVTLEMLLFCPKSQI